MPLLTRGLTMHNYLTKIITQTQLEVEQLKKNIAHNIDHPLYKITEKSLQPAKSFKQAISGPNIDIIAEIKRHSPSKGKIANIIDPVKLAHRYADANASAISVLTNTPSFHGSLADMQQVATALTNSDVAILRKDFIIDPVQIPESIYYGADAILLIVAVTQDKTEALLNSAKESRIDAIVEINTTEELEYAVRIGAEIIAINNRNLNTFEIDPNNAIKLKPMIPDKVLSIAASGIDSIHTARPYIDINFDALLIGEALVSMDDPSTLINELNQCRKQK